MDVTMCKQTSKGLLMAAHFLSLVNAGGTLLPAHILGHYEYILTKSTTASNLTRHLAHAHTHCNATPWQTMYQNFCYSTLNIANNLSWEQSIHGGTDSHVSGRICKLIQQVWYRLGALSGPQ